MSSSFGSSNYIEEEDDDDMITTIMDGTSLLIFKEDNKFRVFVLN